MLRAVPPLCCVVHRFSSPPSGLRVVSPPGGELGDYLDLGTAHSGLSRNAAGFPLAPRQLDAWSEPYPEAGGSLLLTSRTASCSPPPPPSSTDGGAFTALQL